MFRSLPLIMLIILILPIKAIAGTGDVQVLCEPGVAIFVDGKYWGVTTADEAGLFIEGLSPGAHSIKAEKRGFQTYADTVIVRNFETTPIKVSFRELKEKIERLAPEEENTVAKVGIVELRSAPFGAEVYVDGMTKGKCDIKISNVNIGEHRIKFVWNGKVLEDRFIINEGEKLKLKAHFKKSKIINVSEIEKKEKAEKERKEELARQAEKEREKAKKIADERLKAKAETERLAKERADHEERLASERRNELKKILKSEKVISYKDIRKNNSHYETIYNIPQETINEFDLDYSTIKLELYNVRPSKNFLLDRYFGDMRVTYGNQTKTSSFTAKGNPLRIKFNFKNDSSNNIETELLIPIWKNMVWRFSAEVK